MRLEGVTLYKTQAWNSESSVSMEDLPLNELQFPLLLSVYDI